MEPIYVTALIIAAILFLMLVFQFVMWCQRLGTELRYLNKEIARTTGEERENWKRRKKRLLLSIIPFVRY